MFLGLLGPVAVWRDGREVDLGTPQQRALFALRLLHRNEVVSTDRMLDAIWPAGPPRSAMQVLRTYVLRLRGRLRDAEISSDGTPVLVTHRHGYELRLGADQVDADRFESLVTAGRAAREGGGVDASAALLREALGLVRGVPLAELGDDDHARHERERLEELRLVAEEELVEAQLAQGRHRALVPQLRAAVSAQPLRERSWGQLMVALYRSGRQAEALAAYRAASRLFLDELGLAPSGELRALERMILVHDESLHPPSAREHQQPSYRTSFVGRDVELEAIAADLRRERLVTLVGPAGAGKTRLAAEAAADLARALGLAFWWVDLGSVGAGQVAASVSRQLAVRELPGQAPVDLVVRRLHDAPGLLVLDNCEHVLEEVADLVARIVGQAPRVRILSTSREALRIGGEAIRPVSGLRVPPKSADGVAAVMEHAAARLYVERARAATDDFRLDEAAVGWSYELVSRQQRIVLRRLSVFPGSFDAVAAEAVAGADELDPACVLPALTRLVEASLLVAEPHGEATRYVLLPGTSELVRIDRGGRATTLAGAGDGLSMPASLTFGARGDGRRTLFITNFSLPDFVAAPTPGVIALRRLRAVRRAGRRRSS